MLIGALIGALLFLFISDGVNKPYALGALTCLIADLATGAILGTLAGALIGHFL